MNKNIIKSFINLFIVSVLIFNIFGITHAESPKSSELKKENIIISEEYSSEKHFTSVGLSWESNQLSEHEVAAEIRFKRNNEWSNWLDLDEERDMRETSIFYGIASANPSESFQYKLITKPDIEIHNIEWTLLGQEELENKIIIEKSIKAEYKSFTDSSVASDDLGQNLDDIDSENSSNTGSDLDSNKTDVELSMNTSNIIKSSNEVITRAEWGADENKRYLAAGQELDLIPRDEEFYEKFKDELQYSRQVYGDENGKFIWPLQYSEKVKKIIIHHTATTKNLENPAQAIRDIYSYHSSTRGWGDIGYNYIMDQQGNIYEGRYGGEGVIGAHAGPGNNGSIGVAVLGNYQEDQPSEEMLIKLSQFLYKKGVIHDIQLDGTSIFRGENTANVIGHKDMMVTSCPGQNLYDKLPRIRSLSATAFIEKEKFVKEYDFQDRSELYYIELLPDESKTFELKLENIGTKDWNSKTFLKLDINPEFENTLGFPGKTGLILAELKENSVKSGNIGTFEFSLKGGHIGKTVYLNIHPLINATENLEDKINISVQVQPPIYSYEIVDKDYPPEIMRAKEIYDGSVQLKNTGNVVWDNIKFADLTQNIVVSPGEIIKFKFRYKAPDTTGQSMKTMNLEIPNANWSDPENIIFNTLIYKYDYDGKVINKSNFKTWEKGESYKIKLNIRNIGLEDWSKDFLKLNFLQNPNTTGIVFSELSMSPELVETGGNAEISFTVKIAENAEFKTDNLIITPEVNNHMISAPIFFDYKIDEATIDMLESQSDQIRIKLGFEGSPTITANSNFAIYAGDEFLENLEGNSLVAVTKGTNSFIVKTENKTFTSTKEIRFVPKDNAILQITNFEHRPAWNLELNDNQYRGILEVRDVDDELTVINELKIEDYLKGLGEVSNYEEAEKIKSIIIAARSYAKFYTDIEEKFPGKPYHLDDNPEVSQKYLGYGLEKRSPNVTAGVNLTAGKVISYNGELVKAPYFNQSNGISTKSAQEVWGWTNTPYLLSVDDSLCDGDEFLGHGVGLSGCGAKEMAVNGATYEEILKHYYTDIEIIKAY